MKLKIYLIIVLACFKFSAKAQRYVDLSLDTILQPKGIYSDPNPLKYESTFEVKLAFKNLGPDELLQGDTTYVRIWALYASDNSEFFISPSPTTFWTGAIKRNVPVNDTIHWNFSGILNGRTKESRYVNFYAAGFIQNRATNGIIFEDDSTTSNNQKAKQITWYNGQGWGVSVNEVENNQFFKLYPIPAKDHIFIDPNFQSTIQDVSLTFFDLTGRPIKHKTFQGSVGPFRLDLDDMRSGVYILEIKQGQLRNSRKIIIQ